MSDGKEKNAIFLHEWTTLRTLWHQIRSSIGDEDALVKELTKYFGEAPLPPERGGWEDLNRAEQMVGLLLDPVRLRFEYRNLLQLAQSRKLPALSTFESDERHLFQDSLSATPTQEIVDRQRSAYLALLYSLQSGFV